MLCQYAWRQKGIHGNVLKLECMLKTTCQMDVRGVSQWLLPGEEHPSPSHPPWGRRKHAVLVVRWGIILLRCLPILLPPALLCPEQQSGTGWCGCASSLPGSMREQAQGKSKHGEQLSASWAGFPPDPTAHQKITQRGLSEHFVLVF